MIGRLKLPCMAAMAALAAGCAGMETHPALEQARSDVARAEGDALVIEEAPMRLDQAREHLETALTLWDEEGGSAADRVQHEAYLASRNAEIALTQAEIARDEEAIEEAETTRAQVLAEARAAEAARAEQQAARAEQQAARSEERAQTRAQQAERAAAVAAVRERQAEAAQSRVRQLEQELEAERTDRGLVLTLGDVLFDTDGAELKAGAADTVARVAQYLREYPERRALIEGHTDSRGSEEYNRELSERRARAMRDALVDQGIESSRLMVRGMGEQAPIATNETAAGRQENRRVEIVISDEGGNIPDVAGGDARSQGLDAPARNPNP